jgi:dethiobiotin synthetase
MNPSGLFITGTDTNVGKTYVAALIARDLVRAGKRVGVYKPAASGCPRGADGKLIAEDAVALWEAAGRPGDLDRVAPQRFAAPLAPHLSACAESRRVDTKLLRDGLAYWLDRSDIVLVEGAGGLMSPISDDDYNADLAAEFALPLVVVAPNVLGVINQTLQTLITAANYRGGLPLAGVVLNDVCERSPVDPSTATNRAELAARCARPLLSGVSHGGGFDRPVDWYAVAARIGRSTLECGD